MQKWCCFPVNVEIDLMLKPSITVKSWSMNWDNVAEPKQGPQFCLPAQLRDWTAPPLGKNMDNFLASVRGQPADGMWEANSWLQQGKKRHIGFGFRLLRSSSSSAPWELRGRGVLNQWTFALKVYFVCVIVTEGHWAYEAWSKSS